MDCPGVVYEGGDQGPEKVLRNYVAVEQVQDPIASGELKNLPGSLSCSPSTNDALTDSRGHSTQMQEGAPDDAI